MNPKNELDRIAYYMLNIAAVAATGILSASGFSWLVSRFY